mgnify:CR=1 FL=1
MSADPALDWAPARSRREGPEAHARWRQLFDDCYGSDPEVKARILHAQATDPQLMLGSVWDTPLRAYLEAGLQHLEAQEASHA